MNEDSMEPKATETQAALTMAEKIRKKLLIDEKALFDEMLDKSSMYIQLDSTGRIHFKSLDSLRKMDALALFLLGKKLAKEAGLTNEDLADSEESARATGMKKPVAAARLHDLVVEGKVESPERGKFRVVLPRAHSILLDAQMNIHKGEA